MFLEIKSIEKYYGTGENRTKVLKGITTEVEKGKICVLLGPSGWVSQPCSTLSAV